jgi:hypothetical protein
MLTAADCDYRSDPGPDATLFARVVLRLSPDSTVDLCISQIMSAPENLHAVQHYAGCDGS